MQTFHCPALTHSLVRPIPPNQLVPSRTLTRAFVDSSFYYLRYLTDSEAEFLPAQEANTPSPVRVEEILDFDNRVATRCARD
jgi:hypothetical protein